MNAAWGLVLEPLRRRGRALAVLALCLALQAVPAFLVGRLLAAAIDRGFLAGRPAAGLAWLAALAGATLLAAAGSTLAYRSLGAVVEPLRDAVLHSVVTGTLRRAAATRGRPDTAAVARLTAQVGIVRDVSAGLLLIVGQFACVGAAALLGLLSLAAPVALLAAAPVVLAVLAFAAMLPGLNRRQRDLLLADERFAATAGALFAGVRDIVACGVEERFAGEARRDVASQLTATRAVARAAVARTGILALGGQLPVLLVVLAAPTLLRRGTTPGELLGALAYITGALQPALRTLVHGLGSSGLRLAVTLRRLADAGATPAPPSPTPAPIPAPAVPGVPELVLHGVGFRYGGRAEPIVAGFDLRIPAGEHLAVIGSSGVGKSTLADLLAGVTAPDTGTITLGGKSPSRLDDAELRARRVLVPQEAYVFAGTLRENVTYLAPGTGDPALDAAADALGLGPTAARLGGYDVPFHPATLSAGERQLVALARAYLSPAAVVLLDEATCHLDPAAEERAEQAFGRRPGTLVVIAHRLSSARRARRVLLMDGATTHLGSHADLLHTCPAYRDLVAAAVP